MNLYQTPSSSYAAMDPVVPVPMEPELLNDLVEKAKDYALMHGE